MKKHIFALTALLGIGAATAWAEGQYPINYPLDTKISDRGRYSNSLLLTSPSDGAQEVPVKQGEEMLLYYDVTNYCFAAVPGETVIPSFDWAGSWMHGYVYLDRFNDGEFNALVEPEGVIPDDSDVMSYSSYDGYNSVGAPASGNLGVYPPSFVMPNLAPGLYRMRYKVDWASIDPGGNLGTLNDQGVLINTITGNGGGIADVMIYVHEPESGVEVESEHGMVCNYDGVDIVEAGITPGEDFGLIIVPEEV